MLNFIIGTKGSGKTTAGHKILGSCVEGGGSAMLLVPKQFTFESDKGILSLLSPKLACEVEVLSFSRLCHIALQTYGGINKPMARDGVRNILMSAAIEGVKDSLTAFAKHKDKIALTQKMLSQVDEMKNKGISPEELEKCAERVEDKILSQKMRETATVYRAYESVVAQSFFDDGDLLKTVADILRNTDFFKGKTIVIDGFSSFSFGEYKIIEQMLKKAENVYVTLCTNTVELASDLSPFALTSKTAVRLRRLAGNNGVETGKIITTERSDKYPGDLAAIEKNLYLPDYNPCECNQVNTQIICCNDTRGECDTVARKIKALIRTGDYRCRDIAVIFRRGELYEKGIRSSLKKYGVPLFEDKRQPVANQPLICLVRNVLALCSEGFVSDYVFRYLKTGLAGLSVDETAVLENYVFAWDINGKKWLDEWTENPFGFGRRPDEESEALLQQLNSLRERTVAPLRKLREEIDFCSGKKAVELLYRFLRNQKIDENLKSYALLLEENQLHELALEQEQVWDILMEVFDEIGTAVSENALSVKRFSEFFEISIAAKSLGKLPDGFDEVSILSAERALTRNARVVFLVGMNSGVFPQNQSEEGIFCRRERLKIALGGIEDFDGLKELTVKERLLCYNALCSATEKLVLTYSTSDAKGDELSVSECVEWVQKILPRIKTEFASDCSREELIESEKSAFELMAKNWNENSGEIKALKKYFSVKDEYKGRLEAIETALSGETFSFKNKNNAIDLFGEKLYFSASQLESYSQCPFSYFCKYGMKAKPRLRARLDPAQSGTVIHYVLEILLKRHKGREFLELDDKQIDEEIGEILCSYMNTDMGGFADKGERFRYLYNRMHKILKNIMERIREEFSESDFEVSDFELSISRDSEVKPFKIELTKGSAEFFGVIDRVDSLVLDGHKYIRVVDYKTGMKQFRLADVLAGLNMQMLLYLVSIWRNGKGEYENIIPAGVLYFPARMVPNSVERTADEEANRKNRFEKTKMNGLLLENDSLIRHMDKELRGVFLPVKYDEKKDTFKGDFISLEQFEKLAQRLDSYIRQIGDSIHNGAVGARPVAGTTHGDTCDYCDYAEVCINKAVKPRYIDNYRHDMCLEFLSGGEEDGEKLD